MNSVSLVGRLVRDPDVKYTASQLCVAAFTLAVRRDKDNADFIPVKVFGKQAESVEKYMNKGRLVAVQGRLQSGSYKKENGEVVHTFEVIANQIDFVDPAPKKEPVKEPVPDFAALEDDVPF